MHFNKISVFFFANAEANFSFTGSVQYDWKMLAQRVNKGARIASTSRVPYLPVFWVMTLATVPNEHFQDSEEIPDVQFNLPEDVITNDFPLFRPPEMENTGYKEIEDYVDYDAYNMIGARAKKLPNGDKVCFATDLKF